MKKNLLILILLIPTFSYSQEIDNKIQTLSNKIAPTFCGCIEKYDLSNANDKFGNCLMTNIGSHEEELSNLIYEDSIKNGKNGSDKLIFQLIAGLQKPLFDKCQAYFDYVKDLKENAIKRIKSQKVEEDLDSLSKISLDDIDASYYFKKGSLKFAKNELNEAKDLLNKGFELDSNDMEYKILLAWTYEELGNETNALDIYDELIQKERRIEYILLKEYTRRKFITPTPPTLNCKDFQIGEFELTNNENGSITYITRTKNLQIERYSLDGSVTKGKVEWIDDCHYQLTYIESTKPELKEYIGKKLQVEILETNGNSIQFKAYMENVDYIMLSEMQKVEKSR